MRLFLLPISTRRTLIYCEKLHEKAASERSLLDKATFKANDLWVNWEKDEKSPLGWKKKVTTYGNQLLKRIPYEEWGLKTIPALTAKRKKAIEDGKEKYQVMFPGLYLHQNKVPEILKKMASERVAMHRNKLVWSVVAMPFTAPFMLIPVIPNLPFFYLVYRAYSHWKALTGSKHLDFILQHNLPTPHPSWELDEVYTAGLMYPTRAISRAAPRPTKEQAQEVARVVEQQTNGGDEDVMVLQKWNGKLIAEQFHLPDMEVEIERAVEQVEDSIKARDELIEEKLELEKATAKEGRTAKDELPDEVLKPLEQTEKEIHKKAEKVAEKQ
ncbi:hypothetical protein BU24DRAFT_427439 [Aaosphaeria arxii CBS 175.79]|uniref:Mitochondrial K+-H+ exchange-related-domain-containing protein n=1 Tax=Aaosphaeria arxii CBS 175.79 TaxID=1450172 RepID=A0A6A5XBP2_9PLEO|nr:uncharacterized protein BU24DRAFT_427439 [Aaosphaeria arxii CBS 175.79]KAF2010313.1 hypothetical protein BU24DRAFT_427439 [Aaosphaeria arxii CBS 175.79]